MKTQTRTLKISDSIFQDFVRTYMRQGPAVLLLFGGDRISVCDEIVALTLDGEIIACASIAPEGELGDGIPCIVGLYVVRKYRKQGLGEKAFQATVERCIVRGFTKIRVDTLSTGAYRITQKLPPHLKSVLDVHEQGSYMDSFG